ncbi:MAG: hypothetical protein WCL00_10760, partial [Bacteroidota bacterium]
LKTFSRNRLKIGFVSLDTNKPKRLSINLARSLPSIVAPLKLSLVIVPLFESEKYPEGAESYNSAYFRASANA